MKDVGDEYNILKRKHKGKRSLVKPTSIWENKIKLILNKQGGNVPIGFARLRTGIGSSRVLVHTVTNPSIPLTAGKSDKFNDYDLLKESVPCS